MRSRFFGLLVGLFAFVMATAPLAQAGFSLGGGSNYGVLYEGLGGNTLNFSNSNITGNVGIGNSGKWADAAGCSAQCQVMGLIEFSAANTGQFSSNSGTTYTPATVAGTNPLYSDADVTNALNDVNTLSSTLGGESGTSLTITSGGSLNTASCATDAGGNCVYTLQAASNFPNGTFTITGNGTGTQTVVINVPFNFSGFNGSIVLKGGLTSDQVLINVTGGDLTINTNGATTMGTFLDPNGTISINHSVLDGRLFGGDSHNLQFVSGANIVAPTPSVPEPTSILLLGTALAFTAILVSRRGDRV